MNGASSISSRRAWERKLKEKAEQNEMCQLNPVTMQLPGNIYVLECGHKVVRQGPLEEGYICLETCTRVRTYCTHPCGKKCGEDCGPCIRTALKLRPCGLHYQVVRCYQKSMPLPADILCKEMVTPRVRKQTCGHKEVKVYCHEADTITNDEINDRCRAPCDCNVTLPLDKNFCGHPCSGSCGECFQYRLHKKCQLPCGKVMICSHICTSSCGSCPPCELPCVRACTHKKCEKLCGVVCDWECKEECTYSCAHGRCSQPCDEVCNKESCMEPCSKILICGHPCVGFCGETCPPFCRFCDPEKLAIGAILTLGEVDENDRFVYLEKCNHVVENEAMEQWMREQSEDEEILPKCCPICRTRLGWMPRYSAIMHRNWKLIESVKERSFGNKEDITETLDRVDAMLQKARRENRRKKYILCPDYLDRVEKMLEVEVRQEMYMDKANFLEWAMEQWIMASKRAFKFVIYKYHKDLKQMPVRWETLYQLIAEREWPLQRSEIVEFYREKKRLEDYTMLYSLLPVAHDQNEKAFVESFFSDTGEKLFANVQKVLGRRGQYVHDIQTEFQHHFVKFKIHINVTLDVTDEERVQIVEAFGGRTGRWFKCRNGHVYVITECGGAMTYGICPVCKTTIGGSQHRLLGDNTLAPEMDGAIQPLYMSLVQEHEARMMALARPAGNREGEGR